MTENEVGMAALLGLGIGLVTHSFGWGLITFVGFSVLVYVFHFPWRTE